MKLPMFSAMRQAPKKQYRTLVADPPWRYNAPAYGYGADANYPTMTVPELLSMPVGLWATEKAHLYLWTTNSFLVEAHQIAKAWGFDPKTVLTWIKRHEPNDPEHLTVYDDKWLGMGHYFRGVTEHVVFATRGNLDTRSKSEPNFFFAPRGQHSEKPDAFYDLVSRNSYGPFLDVFARKQRFIGETDFEVMDTFGNESFNFGTSLPAEAFTSPEEAAT